MGIQREFVLQQITPMIHFQSNQKGATLRATELKPKLDRFLIEMSDGEGKLKKVMINCGFNEDEIFRISNTLRRMQDRKNYDYFLENVPEGKMALNYKVKIRAESKKKRLKPVKWEERNKSGKAVTKTAGDYFVVDREEEDKSSFYLSAKVTFLCLQNDLLYLIEKLFPYFMETTNFGFRQDKGFGHFRVESCENEKIEIDVKKWLYEYCYHMKDGDSLYLMTIPEKDNYKKMFEQIHLFNQSMKSGISNGKNLYTASYMLKSYSKREKNLENEKKYLKSLIVNNEDMELYDRNGKVKKFFVDSQNVRYYRSVLGLADHYEFSRVKIKGREHRIT